MQNPERIKELLGTGLSNDAVATAVGCDPSYISQLMSEREFAEQVVAMRSEALQANTKRDRKIDEIEDQLIDKLGEVVSSNLIYKPVDILKCFTAVNMAKRRGVPINENLTLNNKIVNLNIPVQVVQNFVTNTLGEVVEAEGQTLVTMPAAQLLKKLQNGDGTANEKYAKIANYLPTAISGGTLDADSREDTSFKSANGRS